MADRNRTLGLQQATERSAASRPMAMKARDRLARRASALWRDTNGLMAPYVAVMLPVLVGFALLALDGSRRMSLQTQMQAAADSLALAGARELNKEAGAESRAISAMANAYGSTKSANTIFGVGSSPTLDLHLRLLFQPLGGERGDRRLRGERGFRREIRCRQSHAADLVNHSSGDILGQYSNQRVRSRRGGGRRFCRNQRLFGRADLRLQPLRSAARDR